MANEIDGRVLGNEELEDVAGGYVYMAAWGNILDMAREKKQEGMSLNQFVNYMFKWRSETGMEGYSTDNCNGDFDSLLDHCCDQWKYL